MLNLSTYFTSGGIGPTATSLKSMINSSKGLGGLYVKGLADIDQKKITGDKQ